MSIDYLKRSGWKPSDAEELAKSNLFAGINTVNDVGYRGILAPLLGIAPDMYNLAENAYRGGRNLLTGSHLPEAPPPHGGSEWWGNEMQKAGLVSDKRRPLAELLAGFVDPATAGAGIAKTAPVMKGIFAGIKAQGAKLDLLEQAKKMMAEGATDKDAWQATGWTHGFADKMPRFEIDDSGMTLKQSLSDNLSNKQNIQEFWGHPELYSNYPESAHIKFMPTDSEKAGSGSYGDNLIKLGMDGFSSTPRDSVTAHELQHAIQEREGFARGSSPEEMKQTALEMLRRDVASGEITSTDQAMSMLPMAQLNAYKRLAGEAEARLVQSRINMTPAERAASYPVDMFDVPVKDQIVRFGNNGPSMAIAYHGSPHKFDKFNLSKIGTGEGAQAFGHGLYFADAEDTAKIYKADRSSVGRYMKTGVSSAGITPVTIAQEAADVHGVDAASYLDKVLKANSHSKNPSQIENNRQVADAINLIKTGSVKEGGNLYKVDIDDNAIANMLDWDKPLSEQKTQGHKSLVQYLKDIGAGGENLTGEEAYKQLMFQSRMEGIASDSAAKRMNIEQMEASRRLNELGIPGLRYLDQGSRGAGQGTRNTVLFDDSLVKILERNGIPVKADPLSALQSAAKKQYRFTNADTPMSRSGYAMFADNADDVRHYGKNGYIFEDSGRDDGVIDADSIYDDVVKSLSGRPDILSEYQSSAEDLAKMINPENIVDSAGAWDAEDIVEEIYNSILAPRGIRAVRTNNGSVVFDEDLIKKNSGNLLASILAGMTIAAQDDKKKSDKKKGDK